MKCGERSDKHSNEHMCMLFKEAEKKEKMCFAPTVVFQKKGRKK